MRRHDSRTNPSPADADCEPPPKPTRPQGVPGTVARPRLPAQGEGPTTGHPGSGNAERWATSGASPNAVPPDGEGCGDGSGEIAPTPAKGLRATALPRQERCPHLRTVRGTAGAGGRLTSIPETMGHAGPRPERPNQTAVAGWGGPEVQPEALPGPAPTRWHNTEWTPGNGVTVGAHPPETVRGSTRPSCAGLTVASSHRRFGASGTSGRGRKATRSTRHAGSPSGDRVRPTQSTPEPSGSVPVSAPVPGR